MSDPTLAVLIENGALFIVCRALLIYGILDPILALVIEYEVSFDRI